MDGKQSMIDEIEAIKAIYCCQNEIFVEYNSQSTYVFLFKSFNFLVLFRDIPTSITYNGFNKKDKSIYFSVTVQLDNLPRCICINSSSLTKAELNHLKSIYEIKQINEDLTLHELFILIKNYVDDMITNKKLSSDEINKSLNTMTSLMKIDHMRSSKIYMKHLQDWTNLFELTGRVLHIPHSIFILVEGTNEKIKSFVIKLKTHTVDIDSRGRPCKERLLSHIIDLDHKQIDMLPLIFSAAGTLSTFSLAYFVYYKPEWIVKLYFKLNEMKCGITKYTLPINDQTSFSYCEKGIRTDAKTSILFIHGLASNKESWVPIVKNIPDTYHCIMVDLQGHGETICDETYTIDGFIKVLKTFIDCSGLIDTKKPLCLIGSSMGAAIAALFSARYPDYVSMVCLLAPPANEACETELARSIRLGCYETILPQTNEQFRNMLSVFSVKKLNFPGPLMNGFLELRKRSIVQHRKVLDSLLSIEYPKLEQSYNELKNISCPTLILWGRDDKLYRYSGADYFKSIIPNSEAIILDECGHFMGLDQGEKIANYITQFYDKNCADTSRVSIAPVITDE
ncbi:unnamed protein product [Didymodactylos carnosus]|uniref:acylglycerol lipase n=1 Tax=Didymodactylos carnosus TaxID=1234261 RepID=A0A814M7D7_9BILA|nr:unnamed protein product [Didymodactylos carnosus]CAF3842144.1 unnamed protein product [Didymodactylos carnosus]